MWLVKSRHVRVSMKKNWVKIYNDAKEMNQYIEKAGIVHGGHDSSLRSPTLRTRSRPIRKGANFSSTFLLVTFVVVVVIVIDVIIQLIDDEFRLLCCWSVAGSV